MIFLVTLCALIGSVLGVGIISCLFYLAERIEDKLRRKKDENEQQDL